MDLVIYCTPILDRMSTCTPNGRSSWKEVSRSFHRQGQGSLQLCNLLSVPLLADSVHLTASRHIKSAYLRNGPTSNQGSAWKAATAVQFSGIYCPAAERQHADHPPNPAAALAAGAASRCATRMPIERQAVTLPHDCFALYTSDDICLACLNEQSRASRRQSRARSRSLR